MKVSPPAPMLPAELRVFSTLVDKVYEGAVTPARWQSILPLVADWVVSPYALMFSANHPPSPGDFLFAHNISEAMLLSYRTTFQKSDPWLNAVVTGGMLTEGNVVLSQELVPLDVLITTGHYKDFLAKADHAHMMSGAVFGVDTVGLPPIPFSFYRGIGAAPFGAAERARFKLIMPHLSRALGVMMRLQDAEFKVAASLASLDRLRPGVVLIDRAGKVVFTNRAASRLLAEEDGLQLKAAPGSVARAGLMADGSAEVQRALGAAIQSAVQPDVLATSHFSRSISIPRFSGRTPYVAQFSSLPVKNEFGTGADTPRAIVFITDPAAPLVVNHQLLRQTYGMTSAEIRTAEVIVQGGTVEEAASAIGVSADTVRTQLKQIYAKTNVDSRARLVRLIHSLAAN